MSTLRLKWGQQKQQVRATPVQWQLDQNCHLAKSNTQTPLTVRQLLLCYEVKKQKYIVKEIRWLFLFSSLKVLSDVPHHLPPVSVIQPPSFVLILLTLFFLFSFYISHSFSYIPQCCFWRNLTNYLKKMNFSSVSKRTQLA